MIPPQVVASIRRMRAADWSVADIAALYHLELGEVRAALARPTSAGPAKARAARERRARRADMAAELRRLRAAGWSVPALAERFGVARSTVCRLAPAAGPGRAEPAWLDDAGAPRLDVVPPPAWPPVAAEIPAAGRVPAPPDLAPAIGSENGRAKLSEADAAELRRLRAADPKRWTYPELARRFGISRTNVFHVLAGRTWRHVVAGDGDA